PFRTEQLNLLAQMVLRKWESMSPPSLIENPFHIETDFFMLRCACPFGRTAAFFKEKADSKRIRLFCF
ncbi:hypothetical protein ACILFN_11110, partial [Capnocytophaga canimorsus]|uniref:hypothetical protein n=1 Tax=Capnocytophaga canimorsus TaxID=28188 RepID=UPI0037CE4013